MTRSSRPDRTFLKWGLFGELVVRATLASGLVLALALASAVAAQAGMRTWESELPVPKVDYQWVDSSGLELEIPWPTASRWVWKTVSERVSPDSPHQKLVLRTWIEVLPPYVFKSAHVPDGWVTQDPTSSPLEPMHHGRIIAVDSDDAITPVTITARKGKGWEQDLTLLIQLSHQKSLLWSHNGHENCAEMGVRIVTTRGDPKFVYAVARCEDLGDSFDLDIQYSPDAVLAESRLDRKSREEPGWVRWRINKPSKTDAAGQVLGSFRLKEREGNSYADTLVYYYFSEKQSRFKINAGLGTTYISYQELPYQISISELALTAKGGASYQLLPGRLDTSISGYINLFQLTGGAANVPLARFFGLNGRIGLMLPTMAGLQWMLSTGWYLWGMIVPDNSYGVSALSGPQVMLSAKSRKIGPRSYYAYVKFAPISDAPGLGPLGNSEIAVGGGYTPDVWIAGRYPTLTLDFSNAHFSSPTQHNTLNLTTASFGFQIPF